MFVINWFLSAFVCCITRLLFNLAQALFSAGRSLYRPLPRYEIEQILRRTKEPLLYTAIKTVRVGLMNPDKRGYVCLPSFAMPVI